MERGLREEVEYEHAGDDERQPENGRQIELLTENHVAGDRDQHDPEAAPERIGDADRM